MARRAEFYRKTIEIDGKKQDFVVQVDLDNKPRIFCSYKKAGPKSNLPDYIKVTLPALIVDGADVSQLADKKIICTMPGTFKTSQKPTSTGEYKSILQTTKQELNITPRELISKLKDFKAQLEFSKEAQLNTLLSKRQGWGFTLVQQKWINEVNSQLDPETIKDIRSDVALVDWDKREGKKTFGTALLKTKIILFNRLYYLNWEEKEFKEIYAHELAHHINFQKNNKIGHDGGWLKEKHDIDKKLFGEKDARWLLARDLVKYSAFDFNYRQSTPDIDDYWKMKDEQSLYFLAMKHGFKLESKNPFIEKMNRDDTNPTAQEYIKNNNDKFAIYNSWELKINEKTSANAYDWFIKDTKALDPVPQQTITQHRTRNI